jgi:hypothetical protein
MTDNVVEIVVKSRSSVREGFDAARKEAEEGGKDSGESYTDSFVSTVTKRMREKIAAPMARMGDEMGKRLGDSATSRLSSVLSNSVDDIGEDAGNDLGDSAGKSFVKKIGGYFSSLADRIRDKSVRAGQDIGDDVYRGIDGRLSDKITNRFVSEIITKSGGTTDKDKDKDVDRDTDKDVDKDTGRLKKWFTAGLNAAKEFAAGFGNKVSEFFSGDLISMLVKALAVGGLAFALGPVIGAAITTAVLGALGGGVLAVGIAAAFKDPRISGAAGELKTKLGKMFEKFGEPFRGPVADFMEKFSRFLDEIAPKVQDVGKFMAPLVGSLGTGFVALLQNAMPGILEAVKASKPIFDTLAKHMPAIGEAIGKFFGIISEQGDDAALFFGDMLTVIEKLIPIIGRVIAALTSMYSVVREVVKISIGLFEALWGTIKWGINGAKGMFLSFAVYAIDKMGLLLAGASRALGWIPGIGPKLKDAERKFNEFRKGVNNELSKIKNKTVTINMEVFGLAAAQAAVSVGRTLTALGYAHGGIVGAANGATSNGLTLVGEHGPELAEVKPGGRVYSNPDSMRMLGQGGASSVESVKAEWVGSGNEIVDALMKMIKLEVKNAGGGSVQLTFGQ